MTTTELSRAEAVKPQSMGGTLAFMEREGLVYRSSHSTDGRQILDHGYINEYLVIP
ncbi:MarR family transcriptional regulator [Kosakonia sp. S42]|uniref:MarR family transcriptional regulator n=1 Tax=Kosakonia sp. S42 TaxID=2767458 RepID=UPI00190DFF31